MRIIDGIEYNEVTIDGRQFLENGGCYFEELLDVQNSDGLYPYPSLSFHHISDEAAKNITTLILPSACKMLATESLNNCKETLTQVIGTNVNYIGDYVFAGCRKLKFVKTGKLRHIGDYAFSKSRIEYVPDLTGVNFLGRCAFKGSKIKGCINKEGKQFADIILIPKNITLIDSVFEKTNIKSVIFEDGGNYDLFSAFSGCGKLTYCNLFDPKENDKYASTTVTVNNCSFMNTALDNISIKKWVTLKGSYNFACSMLRTVYVDTKVSDYCFVKCGGLFDVQFGNHCAVISERGFSYCPLLRQVDLNKVQLVYSYAFAYSGVRSVTGLAKYCQMAFENTPLEKITIRHSVGKNCFHHCIKLKDVKIETSLDKIENYSLPVSTIISYPHIPKDKIEFDYHFFFDVSQGVENINEDVFLKLKTVLNKYNGGYYLGTETNPYDCLVFCEHGVKIKSSENEEINIHPDCMSVSPYAFSSNFFENQSTNRTLIIDKPFNLTKEDTMLKTIGIAQCLSGIGSIVIRGQKAYDSLSKYVFFSKNVTYENVGNLTNPFSRAMSEKGVIVLPEHVDQITTDLINSDNITIVLPKSINEVVVTNPPPKIREDGNLTFLVRPDTPNKEDVIDKIKQCFPHVRNENIKILPYCEKEVDDFSL